MRTVALAALLGFATMPGCSPEEPGDDLEVAPIASIEQGTISSGGLCTGGTGKVCVTQDYWQAWARVSCPKEPAGVDYSITFKVAMNHKEAGIWSGDRVPKWFTYHGNEESAFTVDVHTDYDAFTEIGCHYHRSRVTVGSRKECRDQCPVTDPAYSCN